MKQLFYFLLIVLTSCQVQQKINTEALTAELDSIYYLDQKYRNQLLNTYEIDSTEIKALWNKQNAIDQKNLKRVIDIIDTVGEFPGKSLVGNKGSKAVFYVLQHAPDSIQNKYYDMIIQAGEDQELSKNLVCMYQDRYLMQNGKPQIYGSQIQIVKELDPQSGELVEVTKLWPIADTTSIDSLRMWNGFGPLEDYLNAFGLSRWEEKSNYTK
ncbi:hypothetical protein KMW28_26545 [Flammeovirga yaeyamensis]|uniref:Lipoprotein n=1 Tax=Flammeovirga yaeyamensis TaxID=367791 RepID=A0AAX1NE71_9BACT|nr:DUF6624 domain-containing protein [Flammeovirga yaeyamensis]MBB3701354.1 hypothetical protein [Flammeovirga yaeyamensis]NMF38578.1 hypothetical protein [Flammeovirga yaeyamensis]QWG04458.1 hypothetical protein KMW28_26545 [Flammeovirga yaeyamensis]